MASLDPLITGETRARMEELLAEAIAIGWRAGFNGADIGDLIRHIAFFRAWEDPRVPEAVVAIEGKE